MNILGNVIVLWAVALTFIASFSLGYATGHADGEEEAKEKNK